MKNVLPVMGVRQYRGAVLLLTMVFMLMLAVLAGTVIQSGALQLHMAGNAQFQQEALQRAQAIVTELSRDRANFSLAAAVGQAHCFPSGIDLSCVEPSVAATVAGVVPPGVGLAYRVTRQAPLLLRGFPVRESERAVSGTGAFDAAVFEVSVLVDGSASRLGVARVMQGVAVRVAASH